MVEVGIEFTGPRTNERAGVRGTTPTNEPFTVEGSTAPVRAAGVAKAAVPDDGRTSGAGGGREAMSSCQGTTRTDDENTPPRTNRWLVKHLWLEPRRWAWRPLQRFQALVRARLVLRRRW